MPPPPSRPLLPERVQLLTVRVPPLTLMMPPPREPAWLPERVLLLIVRVPVILNAASVEGTVAGRVQLLIVRVSPL